MIPHKIQPYRCTLDLSFEFTKDGIMFRSVNETTTRLAPPEAMVQLGQVINRIMAHMADNHEKNDHSVSRNWTIRMVFGE